MEITSIFSKELLLQDPFSLLGRHVFFSLFHQMEEGNGEGGRRGGSNDGQALAKWESGWCVILVIVMNLLQHISHRDWVSPSGVMGRTHAPTVLMACTRKEERELIGWVCR